MPPGCLSSWFKDHVDLLQAVLPMILDALSQPSLAPNAALAFRDVCGECAAELAPVVLQIVPVCKVRLVAVSSKHNISVFALGCKCPFSKKKHRAWAIIALVLKGPV